jgi:seryl-tRNA synthetase
MKKTTYMMLVTLAALSTTAFTVWQNILSKLDIAEQDAHDYIFRDFQEGNLSFPYSAAIKKLALGQRAAAVKEMGDYIRQYTNSPEFIKQYSETRQAAKPEDPASKQEKIKKRIDELKQDVEQTEKDMKGVTGDMKKLYEATLQMQRQELKALQDPKDPQHAMFTGDIDGSGGMDEATYKETLKDFEKQYPATVKELVKMRLKEFLVLTADINFDVQLIEKGGHKRFADPKLEAKDELWKRCFRTGKETITAARTYAQQWLKELN